MLINSLKDFRPGDEMRFDAFSPQSPELFSILEGAFDSVVGQVSVGGTPLSPGLTKSLLRLRASFLAVLLVPPFFFWFP